MCRFREGPAEWRDDEKSRERETKRHRETVRVVITGVGLGGRQACVQILALTLKLGGFG